jgi:hypothetical protein
VIIATFISQLRANAPMFGGRVAGAAEFEAGLKNYNTSLPLPAAFVRPLEEEAEPNQVWNGLVQVVHKSIGVVVEVDAQQDRRGQAPIMDLDEVQTQIFASVLNLEIGQCRMVRGTSYSGMRVLALDRARLFYEYVFTLDWQITDADGVQPVSTLPLLNIELDIFNAPGAVGVPGSNPAAVVSLDTGDTPVPPTDGPWPQPDTTEK